MTPAFNFNQITSIEFCLAIDGDNTEKYVQVPVDRNVQNMLIDMLDKTVNGLWETDGVSLRSFELSEKYGSKEALYAPIGTQGFEKVREIYAAENLEVNSRALSQAKDIIYYFVIFKDNVNRRVVAVRRASQFKATLSARNRLISLVDDSLKVIEDDIFKLDTEFDFMIDLSNIFILRPSGFEYIADVAALASEKAKEKTLALSASITFVDFTTLATYAETHKRCARLVSAIAIRNDLSKITREKLLLAAQETKVELEEIDGNLRPKPGHELGFLEILDHRRYTMYLTDEMPQLYVAHSRVAAA